MPCCAGFGVDGNRQVVKLAGRDGDVSHSGGGRRAGGRDSSASRPVGCGETCREAAAVGAQCCARGVAIGVTRGQPAKGRGHLGRRHGGGGGESQSVERCFLAGTQC